MANRNGLPGIEAEFERAELGDARLNKRLMSFASAFANAPDESLPEMAGSIAEREAHYRLLNNERVEVRAPPRGPHPAEPEPSSGGKARSHCARHDLVRP
ncbi:MAG: hypothetical protein IPJ65_26890 [Archangiaceae bacterium]|nr:hypothetical protein [Archangiaceae bacterium]